MQGLLENKRGCFGSPSDSSCTAPMHRGTANKNPSEMSFSPMYTPLIESELRVQGTRRSSGSPCVRIPAGTPPLKSLVTSSALEKEGYCVSRENYERNNGRDNVRVNERNWNDARSVYMNIVGDHVAPDRDRASATVQEKENQD